MSDSHDPFSFDAEYGDPDFVRSARDPHQPPQTGKDLEHNGRASQGRDGRWTHKPGGTEATDLDNSGNPISDPRTADRGGYTDFCGFMIAMHGHTKIR